MCAEGRVDVGQLVMGAVDIAAGKEVDGMVLPRPKLRAAAQEWIAATDTEVAKVVGVAAEGTVTATAKQTEAAAAQDVEADKAPKAPADLIARVAASIKQKQKAEAESKTAA